MKPLEWSPEPFARLLTLAPSPARRRAYSAQRYLFGDRKLNSRLLRDWEVFVQFCRAAGIDVDPANVEMLDPNSSTPPPPDLKCSIWGQKHYVELAEVFQESLACHSAPRARHPISNTPPLTTVLKAFDTILNKKLAKSYNPGATPLSLLLYYDRDLPFWDVLQPS